MHLLILVTLLSIVCLCTHDIPRKIRDMEPGSFIFEHRPHVQHVERRGKRARLNEKALEIVTINKSDDRRGSALARKPSSGIASSKTEAKPGKPRHSTYSLKRCHRSVQAYENETSPKDTSSKSSTSIQKCAFAIRVGRSSITGIPATAKSSFCCFTKEFTIITSFNNIHEICS